jgi:hypothetical protein
MDINNQYLKKKPLNGGIPAILKNNNIKKKAYVLL